jgi:diguanylate cyclase (GGDEF)-like protein
MIRQPVAFPENETVLSVCENMAQSRVGQVLVVDKNWRPRSGMEQPPEPKGIFTERDLIRAFANHRDQVLGKTVGELMTSPVVTVSPDDDLQHAADLMMLMRIRRIPVVEKGKTVGLLTRGRVMEAQAQRFADLQRENAELEERVVHDPLTGLANRVLFEEVLRRELGRAASRGGQVSLLMLDIDHFKKVNDNYGHPVGDVVLRQFAGILRNSLRRADLPARVGGEEFAVVLVQAEQEAVLVAEKIRMAVAQDAFGEQGDSFRITVSIGCAAWKESLGSPEALVKAADEALYEAKNTGRNRVVIRA